MNITAAAVNPVATTLRPGSPRLLLTPTVFLLVGSVLEVSLLRCTDWDGGVYGPALDLARDEDLLDSHAIAHSLDSEVSTHPDWRAGGVEGAH